MSAPTPQALINVGIAATGAALAFGAGPTLRRELAATWTGNSSVISAAAVPA